jgi:hypothetical protein
MFSAFTAPGPRVDYTTLHWCRRNQTRSGTAVPAATPPPDETHNHRARTRRRWTVEHATRVRVLCVPAGRDFLFFVFWQQSLLAQLVVQACTHVRVPEGKREYPRRNCPAREERERWLLVTSGTGTGTARVGAHALGLGLGWEAAHAATGRGPMHACNKHRDGDVQLGPSVPSLAISSLRCTTTTTYVPHRYDHCCYDRASDQRVAVRPSIAYYCTVPARLHRGIVSASRTCWLLLLQCSFNGRSLVQ